jgi:hypothetical protein
MVGQTLAALRSQIEMRADDGGTYVVICGRTKDRFVPLAELRFPDRDTAAEAARFAEQYRATLRRYDPRIPCYDPIVCRAPALSPAPDAVDGSGCDRAVPPAPTERSPRSARIEFCHHVAGAVFEALSNEGYDAVERAVMDAYFAAAETIDNPDTLCLQLLEQMASELGTRLSPSAQAEVLKLAVHQLPTATPDSGELAAACDRLAALGFFERYSLSAAPTGARTYRVSVADYALSPAGAALPTLPITVDVLRRRPDAVPSVSAAERVAGDGWQLTVTTATTTPVGLATTPISENP